MCYSIINSRGILSAEKFKPKGIFYFGLMFRAFIRLKEQTIKKEEVHGEQRCKAKDDSEKFLWQNEHFADVMNAVFFQGREVIKAETLQELGFGCLIIHKDEGKGNHRRTNAGYCEKDKLWN